MDNACAELKYSDGSMIAIVCNAVEDEVSRNIYERSELDYLIYNAPLEYADLMVFFFFDGFLSIEICRNAKTARVEKCNGSRIAGVGEGIAF